MALIPRLCVSLHASRRTDAYYYLKTRLTILRKEWYMQRITAWSYSRWATYEECPFKAKLKFIEKLPEPSGPAAERGTLIHKMAENFLMGKLKTLPPELEKFKKQFLELKKRKPTCEGDLAFTDRWAPTGWFSPDAWLRIKMDAEARDVKDPTILDIVDHKTGKQRDGYAKQMGLYGLGGLLKYPTVQLARVALWFLDHGTVVPLEVARSSVVKMKAEWMKRVTPMLTDTRFSPKPSAEACRWCAFKKAKGGPCKF